MKQTHKIEEVSLWLIFMIIAKQLKWLILLVTLESIVLACVGAFEVAVYFNLIMLAGVIGSYSIHEFVHILLLRRKGVSSVDIGSSFLKFSLIPDKQLRGKELIIVAVSGPIACGMLGVILAIMALLSGSLFLKIMAMIYSFHLINLIPIFGDGKMFIKGLFT